MASVNAGSGQVFSARTRSHLSWAACRCSVVQQVQGCPVGPYVDGPQCVDLWGVGVLAVDHMHLGGGVGGELEGELAVDPLPRLQVQEGQTVGGVQCQKVECARVPDARQIIFFGPDHGFGADHGEPAALPPSGEPLHGVGVLAGYLHGLPG